MRWALLLRLWRRAGTRPERSPGAVTGADSPSLLSRPVLVPMHLSSPTAYFRRPLDALDQQTTVLQLTQYVPLDPYTGFTAPFYSL
jgi:hypothetical protein